MNDCRKHILKSDERFTGMLRNCDDIFLMKMTKSFRSIDGNYLDLLRRKIERMDQQFVPKQEPDQLRNKHFL